MGKFTAIAIDGPAAVGKTTTAKELAKQLGFVYVDTGAMYRAVAVYMKNSGIDINSETDVSNHIKEAKVSICTNPETMVQKILVNDEDVSNVIRTEEIGNAASIISVYPAVRAHLLGLQRWTAATNNVVMEGRDITTHVLPEADVKIYLTADVKVRTIRRWRDLKHLSLLLKDIQTQLEERDRRDMNRETCPLRIAEDAIVIDNSSLMIQETVNRIKAIYEEISGKYLENK